MCDSKIPGVVLDDNEKTHVCWFFAAVGVSHCVIVVVGVGGLCRAVCVLIVCAICFINR